MKNSPLYHVIDDSLNRMFVVDKRGKMVFFPWGGNKQGYYLKAKGLAAKIKKFYISSFFVYLVVFLVATSFFHDFWGIIGAMFISSAGWYLVYYLYASRIVKSLSVVNATYKDIVLENLETEDAEEAA